MGTRSLNWSGLGFVGFEGREHLWVPEEFPKGLPPVPPLASWAPPWLVDEVEGRVRAIRREWGRARTSTKAVRKK